MKITKKELINNLESFKGKNNTTCQCLIIIFKMYLIH